MPNIAEPNTLTFAGTAGVAPGDRRRDVEKQLPQADARGQHAEQHEVKDVGRDHAHRDAVHALAGEVLVVDKLAPRCAGVLQQAREDRPGQGIEHEADRDHRKRPAHAAARGLEQQHQQDRAHRDVEQRRVADPKREVVEHVGDVEHRQRHREPEQPVEQRHATGRPSVARGPGVVRAPQGEHDEDQPQHECQVHAAVRGLAQQAEAGGVVVEARQRDQQRLQHRRRWRPGRPEAHLGIELLLELGDRAIVNRGGRHRQSLLAVVVLSHATRGRAP
jgi:hypothetical protein